MPADPAQQAYASQPDPKIILQAKKLDLEAGYIGRVVGGPKNAPNNIAFVVVALVLVAGVVVSFYAPADRVEFWKLILPIITLTLGYLFGRSSATS